MAEDIPPPGDTRIPGATRSYLLIALLVAVPFIAGIAKLLSQ